MPTQSLVNKPGQFRARCNLAKKVAVAKTTPEQRREAEANDYRKSYTQDHRGKVVWWWHFPACDGFETTDREAFKAHVDEFHGGGTYRWDSPSLDPRNSDRTVRNYSARMPLPVKPFPSPRLTTEGTAWSDEKHPTVTCPGCGLVMEEGASHAAELYIREHLELCAEQAGAA